MKNYIDSQEHWEDSINADYDKKEQMQKEMEKEINKQIEMQIQGQELPIHNVSEIVTCYTCNCSKGKLPKGDNFCTMCDHYF
jgi:hypothetical protein